MAESAEPTYLCPACRNADGSTINILAERRLVVVAYGKDGGSPSDDPKGECVIEEHDYFWQDDSPAWCPCGWEGTVEDLIDNPALEKEG